ncbi:dUTP diphosphatase [Sporosarcina sp. FSL W7-1283]|uniref:dUTP diphosphatase n=1 Tax=Sporosarcina sp. FSL W7-1283 TaxID=2921560 RepID=UPI0030F92E73
MNLTKLFETQRKLDDRIVREKRLEGQDLLPEKILALQVELGELANEQRSWKFWSEDRELRTEAPCKNCDGSAVCHPFIGTEHSHIEEVCEVCQGSGSENPLLEEYVDCLHFILSIGNEFGFNNRSYTPNDAFVEIIKDLGIEKLLIGLLSNPIKLVSDKYEKEKRQTVYSEIVVGFVTLGEMLGFTWEQVEDAYYDKNKINHERQASGY